MRVGSELNIHISMLAATWFRTCPGKSEVDAASCGPGCVPQRCAREVRRRHLFLCNNRCRSHTVARVAPAVVQTNLLVPQLQLLTHSLTHSLAISMGITRLLGSFRLLGYRTFSINIHHVHHGICNVRTGKPFPTPSPRATARLSLLRPSCSQ